MIDAADDYSEALMRTAALDALAGGHTVAELAAIHLVPPALIEAWRQRAMDAVLAAFRSSIPGDRSGVPLDASEPAVHPIVWTQDLVGRFWNNLAKTDLLDLSFSKLAGHFMLQVIRQYLRQDGRHVDFGSGDGHFARLLAAQGYSAAVYEPSKERMARFRRNARAATGRAAPADFPAVAGPDDHGFDTVLMLEVIEHIIDTEMDRAMSQVDRLLGSDGILIVSTPNAEPLQYGMCCDPVSGRVFHRWQHVRSFTRDSLVALFERYGFEPVVIHTIEFSDRVFAGADGLNARVNLDNLFNTRRPLHVGAGTGLVLIARRKGSSALTEWQDAPDEWLRTPIVVEATTCLAVVGSPPAPGTAPADTRLDIEIPPQAIHHADGHEWFVTLDGLDLMSAAASSEHTAPIQLFEGLLPLGPDQSEAATIQTSGRGRYRRSGSRIWFSSSDNTPPTTNGRRYVLTVPRPRVLTEPPPTIRPASPRLETPMPPSPNATPEAPG